MTTLPRLLVFSVFLSLAACGGDKRHAAEKLLHKVGTHKLRGEAAAFYKQLFVAPTGRYFLPKAEQWPPAFRRFEPLEVRAYPDGFSLCLSKGRDGEQGIYVVPQGMDLVPREGRTSEFEKIADGIYWYRFKD